jgi:hypothetical protein
MLFLLKTKNLKMLIGICRNIMQRCMCAMCRMRFDMRTNKLMLKFIDEKMF